ncbi:peptidylprolyl isomerase [Oceaniovalibus sp. ACAM 378]|uniref:FKBP-type peptidyl-prolyl cis-trans isomerase n=1 Tax=Oceaniovalibus sp. ACAM 378 TaxID=2599923 RepID=UPI0011D4CA94|nr:peptidylprolyl isomerase [Oceaniovalibus sp. ACAM 378]TYB87153.1 peptidylprolyl isomerase [Oceaniovalibus sp. ACAM 378]
MAEAKSGDTIKMHYTGSLEDGTVFDSSEGRDPLEFELGSGQIIPGLDSALAGMGKGEEKTVTIPCDQAYGAHDPARIQSVPREQFPDHIPAEVGTQLQVQTPDGQAMPVVIADVSDTEVTLDANHPLAGRDLTFAVEIVEIS